MKFYRCNICGNLVELVETGGGELVCCGEAMEEVIPKEKDLGVEKHLPVVKIDGNKVTVSVGEVEHPMTENHYIMFVALVINNKVSRINLDYQMKPVVVFNVEDTGLITIYSYCNVHGLWQTKINK